MVVKSNEQNEQLANQIKLHLDLYSIYSLKESPRSHLGASQIGDTCDRKLWLTFRWGTLKNFTGKELRIFKRGIDFEPEIIKYLTNIGFTLIDTQSKFSKCDDHYGGSCDGRMIYEGIEYLMEFKTQKDGTSFINLKKNGIKSEKYIHYCQMCIYGKEFNLKKGIYIAKNKQNEEFYIEVVDLDFELAEKLEKRACEIIFSPNIPEIKNNLTKSSLECKWCDHNQICYYNNSLKVNCRTCKHSKPIENAKWFCKDPNILAIIPKEFAISGCSEWISII